MPQPVGASAPSGTANLHAKPMLPVTIAVCCLAIIAALVGGVGLYTGLILRHLVQTFPLWFGVGFGFRRSRATGWISLPLFLFWLPVMVMIWLYLLGIAQIISGHFSPVEQAMTVVVGIASIIGIIGFARLKSGLSAATAGAVFLAFGVLQFVCFKVSFLPAIVPVIAGRQCGAA